MSPSAGLELEAVTVGVPDVERGTVAERAAAGDDGPFHHHPLLAQPGRQPRQVVALDGEADVVHAAARCAVRGGSPGEEVEEELEEDEIERIRGQYRSLANKARASDGPGPGGDCPPAPT